MSAMVFPLLKRIIKFMMGNLLWVIRILERWLEMFDEKEVPLWDCPIPSEKGKGQSEEAKEQGKGTNPGQTPAPSKITYICPLCDDEM